MRPYTLAPWSHKLNSDIFSLLQEGKAGGEAKTSCDRHNLTYWRQVSEKSDVLQQSAGENAGS